jgi:hypothetical protein
MTATAERPRPGTSLAYEGIADVPLEDVVTAAHPGIAGASDGNSGKTKAAQMQFRVPGIGILTVSGSTFGINYTKGMGGAGSIRLAEKLLGVDEEKAKEWLTNKFPDWAALKEPPAALMAMKRRESESVRSDRAAPSELTPVRLPKFSEKAEPTALSYLMERRGFYPDVAEGLVTSGFFRPTFMKNLSPHFNKECDEARNAWRKELLKDPKIPEFKFRDPHDADFNFYESICTPMVAYEDINKPASARRVVGMSHRAVVPVAPGDLDKKNLNRPNPKGSGGAMVGRFSPETKTVVLCESPIEAACFMQVHGWPKDVCAIGLCGAGLPDALFKAITPHGMSVVSAFNNDAAGRKFCRDVGEKCHQHGLVHLREIPEGGNFTFDADDTPEHRECFNAIANAAKAAKVPFDVLKTEPGKIGIHAGSTDETTKLADDLFKKMQAAGKPTTIRYLDKDWNDLLQSNRAKDRGKCLEHMTARFGFDPDVAEHLVREGFVSDSRVRPTGRDRRIYPALATPLIAYQDIASDSKRVVGFTHTPLDPNERVVQKTPKTAGGALLGNLSLETERVVLCKDAMEAVAYWHVAQMHGKPLDDRTCVIGVCSEHMHEDLFKALSRCKKMEVVSAFPSTPEGEAMKDESAKLSEKYQLTHRVQTPKTGAMSVQTKVTEANRRDLVEIEMASSKHKIGYSHLETKDGGFDFKIDAHKDTNGLVDAMKKRNITEGVGFQIQYRDNNWMESLQTKREELVREKPVHASHGEKIDREMIYLATDVDNRAKIEAESKVKAKIETAEAAPPKSAEKPAVGLPMPSMPVGGPSKSPPVTTPAGANKVEPPAPVVAKKKGFEIGGW